MSDSSQSWVLDLDAGCWKSGLTDTEGHWGVQQVEMDAGQEKAGRELDGYKAGFLLIETGVHADGGGHEQGTRHTTARMAFRSLVQGTVFERDENSTCANKCGEPSPNIECWCGWYALKNRKTIMLGDYSGAATARENGAVLLHVTLSGEVFEGQLGWRGERQHVQQIELAPLCSITECYRPTTCLRSGPKITVTKDNGKLEEEQWSVLVGSCGHHGSFTENGRGYTLAEACDKLGCDVTVGDLTTWRKQGWALWRQHGTWSGYAEQALVKLPKQVKLASWILTTIAVALWLTVVTVTVWQTLQTAGSSIAAILTLGAYGVVGALIWVLKGGFSLRGWLYLMSGMLLVSVLSSLVWQIL